MGGLDVAADGGGPVDGVVVDDEVHRAGVVSDEPAEEVEEHFGGQPSGERGEPQRAARGDRGDHVDRVASPGRGDDRGLADWRPRGAAGVIGADPGLVAAVQVSTPPGGLRPDRGKRLTLLGLHRRRV